MPVAGMQYYHYISLYAIANGANGAVGPAPQAVTIYSKVEQQYLLPADQTVFQGLDLNLSVVVPKSGSL